MASASGEARLSRESALASLTGIADVVRRSQGLVLVRCAASTFAVSRARDHRRARLLRAQLRDQRARRGIGVEVRPHALVDGLGQLC